MTAIIKTIGEVTALIPEANTADEPLELLDGFSGDTAFPYARFKAIATVGEVDAVTRQALTGWPDGQAAWLKDEDTIRVAYQSESYATMSNETYPWIMETGVKFTGSHLHYIDYQRAEFADFLNNDLPASTMVEGSGHLFDRVFNVFGLEVTPKTSAATDLAGKWGNQTRPDGSLVPFKTSMQLTQGDFFFHSFCGSYYEPKWKYGPGIGLEDDVWLMGEEWNIGNSMFDDPDGSGPLRGSDVANSTMGLASMVVDLKNEVAYTVPALGQAGYEKLVPMNSGHKDYVVIIASGYNHDINPAPMKVYVGRKGLDAQGNLVDQASGSVSERDKFLARNGLLYGQLYGMALSNATYAQIGISSVDADTKMLDAYLANAAAPDTFSARYIPTSYRWNGFDTPEAVKDTEVYLWAKDGDLVSGVAEANAQPAGYVYFNSDTKVEHSAVDPDTSRFRYIQNHTATGGLLGVEFTSMVAELSGNDANNDKLPDYLSADVTRILAAVNGALTLDVGGKGEGHYHATGNPSGATAEKHIEANTYRMVAPDGLAWIKSSDADVLIVDEDSGNDYGERKFALVIDSETMQLKTEATGTLLALAGGTQNPRALAGVSAYGGTFETPRGSEFSGSWDVTALVARKADGSFYSQEELAGNGHQIVEQSLPLDRHVFVGVVQQGGESGGAVEATSSDYGGQILMFSLDLPGVEPAPVVGTSLVDSFVAPDQASGLTMIVNTIFTGKGADHVDIGSHSGFENSVFTGSDSDTIFAGSRDIITAGSDDDVIYAIDGDGNRLSGGKGDDTIVLGSSGNRALGGAGRDILRVLEGAGSNHLNGGADADEFWLITGPGERPGAKQFVVDFQAGVDRVGLQDVAFSSLSVQQVGADALLKVAGVEVGHFLNTSASSLASQANFAGLLAG